MIGVIENAILGAVAEASESGALGYRLRKVASYGGEFEQDLMQLVPNFPAALVVCDGEEVAGEYDGGFLVKARFTVFLLARNVRNEAARRHGLEATGEAGSYQIAEDCWRLLANRTFALEIDPLRPLAIKALFNGSLQQKALSILALSFETVFHRAAPGEDSTQELAEFLSAAVNWDPPANDLITLREES